MEKSSQLLQLNKLSHEIFSKFLDSTVPYSPHLSLFYGDHNPKDVSRIQEAVSKARLENYHLTIDRLDLYSTTGSPNNWIYLGSFPLFGILNIAFMIFKIFKTFIFL